MSNEPPHGEPLNGAEALDLYFTELAIRIQLMSEQSTLLLQALSERADLLAETGGHGGLPVEP